MMEIGTNQAKRSPKGYGKRPLWQWVVLYVLIGGLLYGLVYYFVIAKHGGYGSTAQQSPSVTSQTSPTSANTGTIYTTKTDPSNHAYLANLLGMALYTYDGDTAGSGTSNCTGGCASNWPPYTSSAATTTSLPANITVITRSDGSKQFAWKGKPLYYFVSDTQAGQVSGDGINGFRLAR